ncbi:hypothetical protein EJ08DRAFT_649593 [Tothia fuscella]|uniref:Carboxylic ester hydrolase n=1 Tax=Tothia fuscella TaxID=1048955 RepID=A0A9P4TXP9_9PEZI|nr:hypothetical protein EJ08DRAFT_649593 [Tothia fuscella]
MQLTSVLVSAILATIATSTPTPMPSTIDLTTIKVISTGFYNGSSGSASDLAAIPRECAFNAGRGSFHYSQFDVGNAHTACIASEDVNDCGSGDWAGSEYGDMINAMAQQVTKDGQFQTSRTGRWMTGFSIGTTAIREREPYFAYFQWGIDFSGSTKGRRYRHFFFSYDFQYTDVIDQGFLC